MKKFQLTTNQDDSYFLRGVEGDGWEKKNRTQSENDVETWQNENCKSEIQKDRTRSEGGVGSNGEIPGTSVSANQSGWHPLPRKLSPEERQKIKETVEQNQKNNRPGYSLKPGGLHGGRY